MNVEIGTEAAQFPEKGYINGIFLAVFDQASDNSRLIRGHLFDCEELGFLNSLFLR
jgi:hypothetical protein